MQLYALNDHNEVIFAPQALKQHNYLCLECHTHVRVRAGIHRQPHFYHHKPNHNCRQSGKSMTHLQIQSHLHRILPQGECQLEVRFPEIQRIADVVWIPQKFIFEIQCSPIKAIEVEQRNQDYLKMGFHVIWVLHDQRFNQRRISAAEFFLHPFPFYFTNINSDGNGFIYDQYETIEGGLRKTKFPPLSIDPTTPLSRNISLRNTHPFLSTRFQQRKIHFKGDLLDLCLREGQPHYMKMERKRTKILSLLHHYVVYPYQTFLYMLLEKASK